MAVTAVRVTVGTSATRVDSDADVDVTRDHTTVMVRCPTVNLYLGGPGVTTATGFLVYANEAFEWKMEGYDALYGVVAVAAVCHVIQQNGL